MTHEFSAVPLEWLVEDDFVILEWLAERDIVTTPKILAYELDIGYSQLRKRLSILERHNLLKHPGPEEVPDEVSAQGVYGITELGRRIASGDVTITEMRELSREGAFDEE
jgi:hypothetical protein